METSTISGNAFYRCHLRPLRPGASMSPQVIPVEEDLSGCQMAQHDACFIHVVDIFGQGRRQVLLTESFDARIRGATALLLSKK
jgi:hypothetical protein